MSSGIQPGFAYNIAGLVSKLFNCFERRMDAQAAQFYSELVRRGFDPEAHVDVLPEQRLVYVCVPKCASTTIKMALSAMVGRNATSFEHLHKRRYSGLRSPAHVGLSTFHRVVTSPHTLRFSFVRNPYERLVSAWADKFQNKPLIPGDSFVDKYLGGRTGIDRSLPVGADQALSFADFVTFACATADQRVDAHWAVQDSVLCMPGITLDFVGKVETFATDFARVVDHAGAGDRIRAIGSTHIHPSAHQPWPHYYTQALAERVYRAYERDFERFAYPRRLHERACA